MPGRQESIAFPIRKTRATRRKSGKSQQIERNRHNTNECIYSDESCDEIMVLSTYGPGDITVINSPVRQRSLSKIKESVHSTRRSCRRKNELVNYRETSLSPQKKQITVHNKEICTPKKLTYERESSSEPASRQDSLSTPVKVTPKITNTRSERSSRKKDCLVSNQEATVTPRQPTVRRDTSIQDENCTTPKKLFHRRELSPEVISSIHACPGASNRSVTPIRSSRSTKDQEFMTPTKRKILSDVEECLSPSKRLLVVLNVVSKECSDQHPLLTSPLSKSQKALPLSLTSPKKSQQNSTLSPVKLGPPNTSRVATDSSVPKIPKPCLEDHSTPSREECTSPTPSVAKRLNMKSPVKSPTKPLVFASPRRSPRKLNNENIPSPQRNLRNASQSPLRFTSPSSIISRLNLNSPSTCKKNLALGLFKPNVSAYRSLCQSLNTSAPMVLVGREKQEEEIRDFLTHHLTQGRPGSLYISGAPGTGKTASVNSTMENLRMKKVKKIFLNCMTLKTAAAIYKAIALEMSLNVSTSEKENRNSIEKVLTKSKQPILLMLDEVDQLDSKNQEVLYTIFEWPALSGSSLVLVGIANSLDLTDRILPRLQALPNFKPKLLHFPPYSKAEIINIINQRIKEANLEVQVIRPSAIQLLAGKVASIAGDVRKALDVCRRAVELCETQARKQPLLKPSNGSPQKKPMDNSVPKMVEIPQVLSIFNEVYGSRVVSAVTNAPESFPLQQKILICCLLLIVKYGRSKDVTLGKFHEVYTRVCKKQQVSGMDQTEFLSLCTLLESRGMLQVKRNKEIRSSKVFLLLNANEAEGVLGDRHLLATVLEDKESLGKLCSHHKR